MFKEVKENQHYQRTKDYQKSPGRVKKESDRTLDVKNIII